jgi:hypothetical protein
VATVASPSSPVTPSPGTIRSRPRVGDVSVLLPPLSTLIACLGALVAMFGCLVMQLGNFVAVPSDEIPSVVSDFVASLTCLVRLIFRAFLAHGVGVSVFIDHPHMVTERHRWLNTASRVGLQRRSRNSPKETN